MQKVINIGDRFTTKYNEEFEVISNKKKAVVKFVVCERVIETQKSTIKDGCSLCHELTKSYYGIGALGFIGKGRKDAFKYKTKEMRLWKSLMKKYSTNGIEVEEYCVFKDFCLKLRELDDYDRLMNKEIKTRLIINKDGSMEVQDIEFLKPCRRVHVRTGKTITYNNLHECARDLGVSPRTVKDYIKKGTIYRGYKIEFIES